MPKHTYTELVAAGAPELPEGYCYRVAISDEAEYEVWAEKISDKYNEPSGLAFIPRGVYLNLNTIVRACVEAQKELAAILRRKDLENEWLGAYK